MIRYQYGYVFVLDSKKAGQHFLLLLKEHHLHKKTTLHNSLVCIQARPCLSLSILTVMAVTTKRTVFTECALVDPAILAMESTTAIVSSCHRVKRDTHPGRPLELLLNMLTKKSRKFRFHFCTFLNKI